MPRRTPAETLFQSKVYKTHKSRQVKLADVITFDNNEMNRNRKQEIGGKLKYRRQINDRNYHDCLWAYHA
jgi:hypothetical protein